jgi:hypothetical protein
VRAAVRIDVVLTVGDTSEGNWLKISATIKNQALILL